MSDVFLEITDRVFAASTRPSVDGLVLRPNSYRTASMGGPIEMSVTVYGTKERLFDLIEWLRCPVRLFDKYAHDLFWGFVNEVQIRSDALEISISLDGMGNKVKLEYTASTPGQAVVGQQTFTDWAQDDLSIVTYGTKELIASLADITAELAENKRDLLLAEKRFPMPSWYMSGEQGSLSASLMCKGWWGSLGWMYFENLSGYEAYTTAGEGVQALGDTSGRMYCAQSFQLGIATGWYADQVLVKVRKQGEPTDNMRVAIYNDSSGSPGTEQAYGLAAGISVPTDYNWVTIDLSTRVWIAPSTSYWVVITRSGSADGTDYYFVDVNEELEYTRGVFKYGDGGTWNTRSPDADMNFEVEGVIETSEQLDTMVTTVGQFIEQIKLETASGIFSCPYRPGTTTGLDEAIELLKAGTSNGRRMLAEVLPSRVLRIYEEPAKPTSVDLLLTPGGRIKHYTGGLWPPYWSPVGNWVGMNNVIPSTIDTSRIADPYMVFIDEFQYSFLDKVGTIYPRGKPSPWDVGIVPTEDKP